jgi:cyclophilin family peptidyl-prolyl cis-trans isomerase
MMTFKTLIAAAVVSVLATSASAQTADWREVAPENLLVIETSKGEVLVELEPRMAPRHVERIRTLTEAGFYDGLKFHRVIPNFMAQTGDPQGTGAGGSELPDVAGEFSFRRGGDSGFAQVENAGAGLVGLMGSMPISTQPDAQMFVTADLKTSAHGLFCPGVAGMARSQAPDSANSQFFLMSGRNDNLNAAYTPFGRVVAGLNVVHNLKAGSESEDGKVEGEPDTMIKVQMASALPAGQRPVVRVALPGSDAYDEAVILARTAKGNSFNICDVQPAVQISR